MAECARLESGYTARYRGFESRPLRHPPSLKLRGMPLEALARNIIAIRSPALSRSRLNTHTRRISNGCRTQQKMILMKTQESVFRVVSLIPRGSVTTYKAIADVLKIKNPRLVGSLLNTNTDPNTVPCHRVVRSDGRIADGYAFGGASAQRRKLKNEGVAFIHDRVLIKKHLWRPARKVRWGSSPSRARAGPQPLLNCRDPHPG